MIEHTNALVEVKNISTQTCNLNLKHYLIFMQFVQVKWLYRYYK